MNSPAAGFDQGHNAFWGTAAVINDAFVAFLYALPYLPGVLLVLGGIYGFFAGLSLKPHKDGHRPGPNRFSSWSNWERW